MATMHPVNPKVGVYGREGHRATTVSFKRKWQAHLFHLLLNASMSHMGTREY